jgi:hypothetical protein
MTKIALYILSTLCITALLFNGCSSESNVNCIECISKYDAGSHLKIKPDSANIKISVTINSENTVVPLIIYKGLYTIPEPAIEISLMAVGDTIIKLPVDREYSVKAEYNVGNKKLYAIDGGNFATREIKQACDTICWVISGDKFDVSLDYSSIEK